MNALQKKVSLSFYALFLAICAGSFFLFNPSSFANSERFPFFSDVSIDHKNFDAITRLMHENIINGYSDGSFQPDKKVSRAEALKILLLGSNIATPQVTQNPFSDVEISQWFAPYVSEAKTRNIVQGRGNTGKFFPSDSINRAEALKMMLLVNGKEGYESSKMPNADVPLDSWFAKYFEDARLRGIFDASRSQNVNPGGTLTRGELVEMMYRFQRHEERKTSDRIGNASWYKGKEDGGSLFTAAHRTLPKGSKLKVTDFQTGKSVVVRINDRGPYLPNRIIDLSDDAFSAISTLGKGITKVELEEVPENTPEGKIETKNSAPQNIATIPVDTWDGIQFTTEILPVFRKGEIHIFRGSVKNADAKTISGILTYTNGKTAKFSTPITGKEFRLPIFFENTGSVQLGFLLGSSGSYITHTAEIFSGTQNISSEEIARKSSENFTASFQDGKIFLQWSDAENTLFHIKIRQNERIKNLYVQDMETSSDQNSSHSVAIPTSSLTGFSKGKLFISLRGAKTVRNDSLLLETPFGGISALEIPVYESFEELTQGDISLSDVSWEYSPNQTISVAGTVKEGIQIGKGYVLNTEEELFEKPLTINGKAFSMSFTPQKKDFFIIEITDTGGRALGIIPVTPKGYFPVLPNDRDTKNDENKNIQKISVQESFERVNTFRKKHGKSPLELDFLISELAQIRAEDMNNRNYFSHITPNGKDVNDFRIDLGIKVSLSENIALHSNSGLDATYSLEFSPTHRKNLLADTVSRIGIGLEEQEDGNIILVQLFGGEKLSESLLLETEKTLHNEIIQNFPNVQSSEVLQKMSEQWAATMAEKKKADFEFSSGEKWDDLLVEHKIQRSSQVFIASFPSAESAKDFIQNKKESFSKIISSPKKTFGLSLSASDEGVLFLCLVGEE